MKVNKLVFLFGVVCVFHTVTTFAQPVNLTPADRAKAAATVEKDLSAKYTVEGTKARDNKQFITAALMANRALVVSPNDPDALLLRARVMFDMSQFQRSLSDLKRLEKVKPNDAAVLEQMGLTLLHSGYADEAHEYFKRAAPLRPDDIELINNAGTTARISEQWQACADYYGKSIEKNPGQFFAHFWKGMCLAETGKRTEAQPFIDEAARLQPSIKDTAIFKIFSLTKNKCETTALKHVEAGWKYWQANNATDAFREAYLSLKCDPNYDNAMLLRLRVEMASSGFAVEALYHARKARKMYPTQFQDLYLKDKKTLITEQKDNPEFYKNYAGGEDQYKQNARFLGDQLSFYAVRPLATAADYLKRAHGAYDNGWPLLAILDASDALYLDPNNIDALMLRARGYASLPDPALRALAFRDATAVIATDPKRALAYNALGLVYEGEKNYDLAIANYTKAIEVAPTSDRAYGNRARVNLDLKKDAAALADAKKAVELAPDNFQWLYYRAGASARLGNMQGAHDDYAKVIAANPKSYDARVLLIGIADKMGNKAEADEHHQWLIQNAPANYNGIAFLDNRDPAMRQKVADMIAAAERKRIEDERLAAERREREARDAKEAKVRAAVNAFDALVAELKQIDANYGDAMDKLNKAAEEGRRKGVDVLSFYKGTYARAQAQLDRAHKIIREFLTKYDSVLDAKSRRKIEDWDDSFPTYVPSTN